MATVDDEQDEQDLTRKQRREQARAERKSLEESERAAARNRSRLIQIGAAVAVAVVVAVIVILAASGGGKKHAATGGGQGINADLQVTPGPWAPEYTGLVTRLQALHLPTQSDVAYHVHADLRVYVNGTRYTVPAQIGIDTAEEFLAPLHTHDTSGIIHQEASEPYPFTLGMFFTIWGVKFTSTQLGSWVAGNGNVLSVYANGTLMSAGPNYVMKPHDDIVVGYGKPGSFPTSFTYPWASSGL